MGKGERQCQMRGAEALGSENRGAQRGWEAGSPPTVLGTCARARVSVWVCVWGGVVGGWWCVKQRRGEGCRVGLRDPVAKMELWLLEGHGVIGWLRAGLDMPVRNLHAHPPSSTQPSQLLWDNTPKPGLDSPGHQGFFPRSRFFSAQPAGVAKTRPRLSSLCFIKSQEEAASQAPQRRALV